MKSFAAATLLVRALVIHDIALAAPSSVAGTVDAQAEVAAVLYAASATQAALAKSIDAELRGQQNKITALQLEIKSGNTRHRADMSAAEESFVAALAAKDREYAVQIGAFRSSVDDIASTPEGVKALARFNAGDEVGAIAILDRLRAANERMRQARAKLDDAAEGRRIARLALEAQKRGKLPVAAVIARFEEVVELDPGAVADWWELGRLYRDVGRLADAKRAADGLMAAAKDNHDRSTAFSELSTTLMAQGDLAGARGAAEQAVALSRRVAAADPKNADLEHTLSRTLLAFGEVARRQGDLDAAEAAYQEDIVLTRRLVAADPQDEHNREFLDAALLHLADVLFQRGDLAAARPPIEEGLAILHRLAAEFSDNTIYQREIDVTLMWLSDVLVSQGRWADARKANAEIIATSSRLIAADPGNLTLQRYLACGYSKTAIVQRIDGDFDGAVASHEHALGIDRELSAGPSAGLDAKTDVGEELNALATVKLLRHDIEGSLRDATQAVTLMRSFAAGDATNVGAQQNLGVALDNVGAALAAKKDAEGARKAFDEALAIHRALVAKTPGAEDIALEISDPLLGIGTLSSEADPARALASLQQSLDLRRKFAAAHPKDSSAQRGVAEAMRAFVDKPGSTLGWSEFRAQVEAMEKNGLLWPADREWLKEARRHGAAAKP
jgi:tetratricopeptide (TPR) repeat protein